MSLFSGRNVLQLFSGFELNSALNSTFLMLFKSSLKHHFTKFEADRTKKLKSSLIKVTKREIFVTELFILSDPFWILT
jgi:hypothetical protein